MRPHTQLSNLLVGFITGLLLLAPFRASAQSLRLAQPNAARFPEVTLFAYPTDGRGVLVDGLGRESFRVTENGQPAELVSVENQGGELDVCLALDSSGSMLDEDKLTYARNAAGQFIQQLGPRDRAAVLTFASASRLIMPLSNDRNSLFQAAMNAESVGDGTAFLDAVYWSITQVALQPKGNGSLIGTTRARPEARRLVLALTDGLDNNSNVSMQELVEYARANGVSVCTVSLGRDSALGPLITLAQETGGVALHAPTPQDLERLYAAVAEQLRKEYRVTFRSPLPEKDAKRREVKVTLAGSPLSADTWYQAPGQGSLLVTASGGEQEGASPLASGQVQTASRRFLGVAVAAMVLLAAGVTGFFWWFGRRHRSQPLALSTALPVAGDLLVGKAEPLPQVQAQALWVHPGITRVGRGIDCEVVLDSTEVSRHHAWIETAPGGQSYLLVDEESRNGTYLNGRRISREPLRPGDLVRFGDREFRFAGALTDPTSPTA